MVPLVVFACFSFRPLAFGDIAAHVTDVHGLSGLRIVDPKARVEDRDRIAGLEMAETHLSRPGTLLEHRRPEDLIHKLPVLGENVVNSAPLPRFLPAVESDHFHPGLVEVDRRASAKVGNRHKVVSLLHQRRQASTLELSPFAFCDIYSSSYKLDDFTVFIEDRMA